MVTGGHFALIVILSLFLVNVSGELVLENNGTISVDQEQGNFLTGFLSSLQVTILGELGDNSFFIQVVLAMKNSRLVVFLGAMSAMFFMAIFTAIFGLVSTLIPRIYTHYFSIVVFTIFGIKMLWDGCRGSKGEGDHYAEEKIQEVDQGIQKEEQINDSRELNIVVIQTNLVNDFQDEDENSSPKNNNTLTPKLLLKEDAAPPLVPSPPKKKAPRNFCGSQYSHSFFQALTMTFLAEWGDRSQLATVVIASRENIWAVCVGGLLGHALCCLVAVIGGKLIAKKISIKTVQIVGGVMFLCFAIAYLCMKPPVG